MSRLALKQPKQVSFINQVISEAEAKILSETGITMQLLPYNSSDKPLELPQQVMQWTRLKEAVVAYFGVSWEEISGKGRRPGFITPRFCWCYIGYNILKSKSLPEMGALMQRDHTTVLYAVRSFGNWLETKNEEAVQAFDCIMAQLKQKA